MKHLLSNVIRDDLPKNATKMFNHDRNKNILNIKPYVWEIKNKNSKMQWF